MSEIIRIVMDEDQSGYIEIKDLPEEDIPEIGTFVGSTVAQTLRINYQVKGVEKNGDITIISFESPVRFMYWGKSYESTGKWQGWGFKDGQ